MPRRNTVYRWRLSYPEFGDAYLLAQEQHVDALVDEAGKIVDTVQNPMLGKIIAGGLPVDCVVISMVISMVIS